MNHRTLSANGIRIHAVEEGEGPLVLLIHGFPESWYSWRHQLPAIAAAGYQAVAIDVRGYGRSSKPAPIEAYRMMEHVADNLGVVHALGHTRAVIIGHDWGSPIAQHSALLHPDVFVGLGMLSVAYSPRGKTMMLDAFRRMAGPDNEFYIEYFQEPGRAEADAERDLRAWLLGFYYSASGDAPAGAGVAMSMIPRGESQLERMSRPEALPDWLTDDDLERYVGEFERTGLTGGLNRYRNVKRDWEDFAPWEGKPIEVPAVFIGGEKDGPTVWGAASIAAFPETVPQITGSHILPGCGHWVQQERAAETNALLLDFLRTCYPAS